MKLWNQPHEPVFRETTVHYIFTWSTAGPINIRNIASKLLDAGIAETTSSPAYPEVRISPRLAKLGKLIRDLERVKTLYNVHTRFDLIKWMARHPLLTARIWRLRRSHQVSASDAQPGGETGFAEIAEQIKQIVWGAQATNAVQQAIESDLYSPAYLSNEPYLRLTLHGFACWLDITDGGIPRKAGDTSGGVQAEVLLLIHQSGCIQLTVVLRLPDNLPADALGAKQWPATCRSCGRRWRSQSYGPLLSTYMLPRKHGWGSGPKGKRLACAGGRSITRVQL